MTSEAIFVHITFRKTTYRSSSAIQCCIQMRLVPKGRLVARARDANVYAALTLAVERAVRLLDRKLKRRRSLTRFRMEELR